MGESFRLDREIAAVATKVGLPGLRYLSFGNAPTRRRLGADERAPEAVVSAESAEKLDRGRTHEGARAEVPPDGHVEAFSAAARPCAPLAENAPTMVEAARTAAKQAPADAAGTAAGSADFLLLRALEELWRDRAVARTGAARDQNHRAHLGGGEAHSHSPGRHGAPSAAPSDALFDLTR